jgi:hypothetical protein
MRRLFVLTVAFTAFASVGQSATAVTPHGPPFAFGGNGLHGPYIVHVNGDGSVQTSGDEGLTRAATQISPSQLVALNSRAAHVHFGSFPPYTRCTGGTRLTTTWIQVGSKKVTVAGTCIDAYQQLWRALVAATHFFRSD